MAVVSSVDELIGNTPVVDISQLSPNPAVRILAKLETFNPGLSKKDRWVDGLWWLWWFFLLGLLA